MAAGNIFDGVVGGATAEVAAEQQGVGVAAKEAARRIFSGAAGDNSQEFRSAELQWREL